MLEGAALELIYLDGSIAAGAYDVVCVERKNSVINKRRMAPKLLQCFARLQAMHSWTESHRTEWKKNTQASGKMERYKAIHHVDGKVT